MSDPVGIPFGSYRLIRRIALGGMAEVFLARQTGLEGFDRLCALKRILPHLANSPEFVKMFLDEARLAAQLRHPHAVHIYDFGKVDSAYFIAMEFVDGVSAGCLIEHAATEPIPFGLVARIGVGACAGLDYAHNLTGVEGDELALVHRDVSPPNLLVSYDGAVKLVDFGIAKAESCVEHTRPGVVKGKYAYMSPEQTTGAALDGRSDVFSLGIILWELLAGCAAVRRDDPVEAMKIIRDGKIPPILSIRPDVPKQLAMAIDSALTKKVANRASALELGLTLERYIKRSEGMSTNLELAQWLRTRFRQDLAISPKGPGATRQATQATREATEVLSTSLTQVERAMLEESKRRQAVHRRSTATTRSDSESEFDQPTEIMMKAGRVSPTRRSVVVSAAIGALAIAALVTILVLSGNRGDTKATLSPPAQPALASLEIITSPADTIITIGDQRFEGSGALVTDLAPGSHQVVVERSGYHSEKRTIEIASGQDRTVELALKRKKTGRGTRKPSQRRTSKRTTLPNQVKRNSSKRTTEARTANDASNTKDAAIRGANGIKDKAINGTLRVRSQPYAIVYLGRRKLGVTPLSGVSLPPGKHRLRFYNPELKREKTRSVTIQSNQVTRLSIKL